MTAIFESLLHAEAVGVDDSLQQAGLECLQIVGTAFRAFRPRATEIVRRFLGSPALHPAADPTVLTPVLRATAQCYGALLRTETGGDAQSEAIGPASAVQTLLNRIESAERYPAAMMSLGSTSALDLDGDLAAEQLLNGGSAGGETAATLVHVVSLLAQESGSDKVRRALRRIRSA